MSIARDTQPDGEAEPRRVIVSYRRTSRQSFGRGLVAGAGVGVSIAIVIAAAILGWRFSGESGPHVSVLWLATGVVISALVGATIAVAAGARTGVDADDEGLHGVPPSPLTSYPWLGIADVRAERRGGRSVIVVELHDGESRRLRAPYDGRLCGRDRRFEEKFFMLINLWEMHRSWRGP